MVKKQSRYLTFDQFLQSPVIRYQCLICQMNAGLSFNKFSMILIYIKTFSSIKQRLYSQKYRNCDCLFTNLVNYYSHQWSNINVWYIKWRLESSSMNLQSYWLTTKHFSLTNKDSRAQKTEIVTVCLPFWSISAVTSDQMSMFDM